MLSSAVTQLVQQVSRSSPVTVDVAGDNSGHGCGGTCGSGKSANGKVGHVVELCLNRCDLLEMLDHYLHLLNREVVKLGCVHETSLMNISTHCG